MSANTINNNNNNNNSNNNNNTGNGAKNTGNTNNNDDNNSDLPSRPRIVIASDTASLKSETSSICRPLKLSTSTPGTDTMEGKDSLS